MKMKNAQDEKINQKIKKIEMGHFLPCFGGNFIITGEIFF